MLYTRGGCIVNSALMDKEVDAVKEHFPFLQVNTPAAREHVGEIERKLTTVKEQVNHRGISFSEHSNHGSYLHGVQCVSVAKCVSY